MSIIDQCCKKIDFLSIDSSDLTQYLLAVDRDNAKVTRHYNSLNPAFLRALGCAVRAVHRQGKWIGLCGKLDTKGPVPLLLMGLGLDELSMSVPSIPAAKARTAQLDSRACRQLLNQAVTCRTLLEVKHLLARFRVTQQDTPPVTAECITLGSNWRSKKGVIRGMTDNLPLADHYRCPHRLKADLQAREAIFPTGLGFSFIIPRSKSEHIEQSTISVARLQAPVRWGDDDAQFTIMLTLNKHVAGDQHIHIFSRLARRITHEEFRSALVSTTSTDTITSLLQHELELQRGCFCMELYLDTASVAEVEHLAHIFPIAGVTTNPSVIAASRESIWDVLPHLQDAIGEESILFAQAMSQDVQGMVEEAKRLSNAAPDLVVGIPVTPEGLVAIKILEKEDITTLGTAVYSASQGLLAALVGTKYIAPCVNRVGAQDGDGVRIAQELQTLLELHAPNSITLAASFKTPRQTLDYLLAECEVIALPLDATQQVPSIPAVESTIEKFKQDWNNTLSHTNL